MVQVTSEIIASGILLAAVIIFMFRLSLSLWGKNRRALAIVLGVPAIFWGAGLIAAAMGFGDF